MPLSLAGSVKLALQHNLGLLFADQDSRAARGVRWQELSRLLPDVTTATSETVQQINLEAFGFSSFPGVPQIVGPFSVADTRAFLTQPILDFKALNKTREASEKLKATQYSYEDARDLVVLVSASLYLRARAGQSRIEAAQAQVKTAQALYDRAVDLKKAGTVPAIDVLRAQVELQAQRQRLIFFQNEFEKQKLDLARAIGLSVAQEMTLTDPVPYSPLLPISFDEALARAYRSRGDYQQALALLNAAQAAKRAARGEALPSLRFDASYGDIGKAPGASHGTFAVAASVIVPIFQGGRVHGKVLEADAQLQKRQAKLEDYRNRIEYEIRTAFLDLKATEEQVNVAKSAVELANEQMKQAQDRFSAGVVNTIEVVQAQEAMATADENFISSLYSFNVAKAFLARTLGEAAERFEQFLGGKP
jgi:outer membrane protein TolC